ncbi:otoancorin-like [Phascolarctos cinereus]
MFGEPRIYFLLLFLMGDSVAALKSPNSRQDLHPLLQKMAEEIIEGRYLNALLDLIQFQSSNVWTSDLSQRLMAYFHSRNVAFTVSGLQATMENYLENLLYQPQKLLADFRQTDDQQFRTAMKCLFEDKKSQLNGKTELLNLCTSELTSKTKKHGFGSYTNGNSDTE